MRFIFGRRSNEEKLQEEGKVLRIENNTLFQENTRLEHNNKLLEAECLKHKENIFKLEEEKRAWLANSSDKSIGFQLVLYKVELNFRGTSTGYNTNYMELMIAVSEDENYNYVLNKVAAALPEERRNKISSVKIISKEEVRCYIRGDFFLAV